MDTATYVEGYCKRYAALLGLDPDSVSVERVEPHLDPDTGEEGVLAHVTARSARPMAEIIFTAVVQ